RRAPGASEERDRSGGDSPPHDWHAADDLLPALLGHRTGRQARGGVQSGARRARENDEDDGREALRNRNGDALDYARKRQRGGILMRERLVSRQSNRWWAAVFAVGWCLSPAPARAQPVGAGPL